MNYGEKVKEFTIAAGQVVPEKAGVPSLEDRILRCKLIFEEFTEHVKACGLQMTVEPNRVCIEGIRDVKFEESELFAADIEEAADSLIDLTYVTEGALICWGFNPEPLFNLVHENNMTKFKDGYRDESGKWRKGPSYKPVDLSEEVNRQVRGDKELNWVNYSQKEFINVPNGMYISKGGEMFEFTSGPRDEYVWTTVNGKIDKGLKKEEFTENFKRIA